MVGVQKQIPLPDLEEGDFIAKLETGARNTALITDHGKVHICGNFRKKDQKRAEAANESPETTPSD
jgi:hypothetical protein